MLYEYMHFDNKYLFCFFDLLRFKLENQRPRAGFWIYFVIFQKRFRDFFLSFHVSFPWQYDTLFRVSVIATSWILTSCIRYTRIHSISSIGRNAGCFFSCYDLSLVTVSLTIFNIHSLDSSKRLAFWNEKRFETSTALSVKQKHKGVEESNEGIRGMQISKIFFFLHYYEVMSHHACQYQHVWGVSKHAHVKLFCYIILLSCI